MKHYALVLILVLLSFGASLAQDSSKASSQTKAAKFEVIAYKGLSDKLRALDAREAALNDAIAQVQSFRASALQDYAELLAPIRERLGMKDGDVSLDEKACVFFDPLSVGK